MEDPEIAWIDDAPITAGHRLRARWGADRWWLPAVGAAIVAYAPDGETLFVVGADAIVRLDRTGRRVGEPARVRMGDGPIAIARGCARVAWLREWRSLSVADLASGAVVRALELPGKASGLALSEDGRIVAAPPRILRLDDGAQLAELDAQRIELSPDGSHALAFRYLERYRVAVSLHRVGGAELRHELAYEGVDSVAWSRDGERVAWTERSTIHVWSVRDGASIATMHHGLIGGIALVPTDAGEQVLGYVGTGVARDLVGGASISLDGRAHRLGEGRPWVTTPDRRRALLYLPDGMQELDVRTGERGPVTPRTPPPVTTITWAPSGARALVVRTDGDLRVWDVEAWRTERVIDPERAAITRTERTREDAATFTAERVIGRFAADGATLLFVDARAVASVIAPDGRVRWRRPLEIEPWRIADVGGWESDWRWRGAAIEERGDEILVRAHWDRQAGMESYANPLFDDLCVAYALRAEDGRVLRREKIDLPFGPATPSRFTFRSVGYGYDVSVDGARLEIDPMLGSARIVSPSPDERFLLVGTTTGLLLRFDRVSP